jgi:hypothetical protein
MIFQENVMQCIDICYQKNNSTVLSEKEKKCLNGCVIKLT